MGPNAFKKFLNSFLEKNYSVNQCNIYSFFFDFERNQKFLHSQVVIFSEYIFIEMFRF